MKRLCLFVGVATLILGSVVQEGCCMVKDYSYCVRNALRNVVEKIEITGDFSTKTKDGLLDLLNVSYNDGGTIILKSLNDANMLDNSVNEFILAMKNVGYKLTISKENKFLQISEEPIILLQDDLMIFIDKVEVNDDFKQETKNDLLNELNTCELVEAERAKSSILTVFNNAIGFTKKNVDAFIDVAGEAGYILISRNDLSSGNQFTELYEKPILLLQNTLYNTIVNNDITSDLDILAYYDYCYGDEIKIACCLNLLDLPNEIVGDLITAAKNVKYTLTSMNMEGTVAHFSNLRLTLDSKINDVTDVEKVNIALSILRTTDANGAYVLSGKNANSVFGFLFSINTCVIDTYTEYLKSLSLVLDNIPKMRISDGKLTEYDVERNKIIDYITSLIDIDKNRLDSHDLKTKIGNLNQFILDKKVPDNWQVENDNFIEVEEQGSFGLARNILHISSNYFACFEAMST